MSPLGIIPRKAPGEYHVFITCLIPSHLCTIKYTPFDQAVCMAWSCGPWFGALVHQISLSSSSSPSWGLCFQRQVLHGPDTPYGMFHVLLCIQKIQLLSGMGPEDIHYLDNFFFSGSLGSCHCADLLSSFCFWFCGPISWGKTEGPVQRLTFLGFELDTMAQASCLPDAKLVRLAARCPNSWATVKLQSKNYSS